MLDEEYTDYSKACTQPWIAIRLAEVILNHAEACYRLNADGANADLRRIRERVGLPYTDPVVVRPLSAEPSSKTA